MGSQGNPEGADEGEGAPEQAAREPHRLPDPVHGVQQLVLQSSTPRRIRTRWNSRRFVRSTATRGGGSSVPCPGRLRGRGTWRAWTGARARSAPRGSAAASPPRPPPPWTSSSPTPARRGGGSRGGSGEMGSLLVVVDSVVRDREKEGPTAPTASRWFPPWNVVYVLFLFLTYMF